MFECYLDSYTKSKNVRKQQKTGLKRPHIILKDNTLRGPTRLFPPVGDGRVKRPIRARILKLNRPPIETTLYNPKGPTMKLRNRLSLLLVLLVAAVAVAEGDRTPKIELKQLEGDWEGNGEFLMPVTDMNISLDGTARFDYDTANGRLRTSLTGEKLFFTYADSGYLEHDQKTDSISWEVWDNFGKHAKYFGTVNGNIVTGVRNKKDLVYRVRIELVTADSIDFRLTITKPDGEQYDRAAFHLWRVED